MAENNHNARVETGAEMDYKQHEQTYRLFLTLAKYGALHVVAILIAMGFGFFTTAGFFSSLLIFILISAVGIWILRQGR